MLGGVEGLWLEDMLGLMMLRLGIELGLVAWEGQGGMITLGREVGMWVLGLTVLVGGELGIELF